MIWPVSMESLLLPEKIMSYKNNPQLFFLKTEQVINPY